MSSKSTHTHTRKLMCVYMHIYDGEISRCRHCARPRSQNIWSQATENFEQARTHGVRKERASKRDAITDLFHYITRTVPLGIAYLYSPSRIFILAELPRSVEKIGKQKDGKEKKHEKREKNSYGKEERSGTFRDISEFLSVSFPRERTIPLPALQYPLRAYAICWQD